MCVEAYLQGQDMWELVVSADIGIPTDTLENAKPQRKRKIKYGKSLCVLKTSINKEFIDHVRDVTSLKEYWETLERLFFQKNIIRLQLLENELLMLTQRGMSIFIYFLGVKSIYTEILELDLNEEINETRLQHFFI